MSAPYAGPGMRGAEWFALADLALATGRLVVGTADGGQVCAVPDVLVMEFAANGKEDKSDAAPMVERTDGRRVYFYAAPAGGAL